MATQILFCNRFRASRNTARLFHKQFNERINHLNKKQSSGRVGGRGSAYGRLIKIEMDSLFSGRERKPAINTDLPPLVDFVIYDVDLQILKENNAHKKGTEQL